MSKKKVYIVNGQETEELPVQVAEAGAKLKPGDVLHEKGFHVTVKADQEGK